MKNQYENAKKSAKECLNIKRNYAPAYFELGISEKALGNKVAAADAFEKAKKDKNWRKSAQFELDKLSKGF
jgi:tetratricopeptide (TPR) repeat protein